MKKLILFLIIIPFLGFSCTEQSSTISEQQAEITSLKEKLNNMEDRQLLLTDCLATTDEHLVNNFKVICRADSSINEGNKEVCEEAAIESVLGYMNSEAYRNKSFTQHLKSRESEREECFKLYK